VPNSQQRQKAYLQALIAVTIWGATFVATKIALREASPAALVWARFGMGVLILGAAVWRRKQFALPRRQEWLYFAFLGFLGVTFHQWLQATGLQTASATTTAWIVATIPAFTAILGWLFLREKLKTGGVAGLSLAAAGVLLIVSKGDWQALAKGSFGAQGDFLILLSALNWAVFSVLSRRGLQKHPATRMMFYVMLHGWLFSALWLFGWEGGGADLLKMSAAGWASLAVLGIFGSGIAYLAWYDALQTLPAAQLSVFIYIEPLVTVITAALLLGEGVTWASLLGGAMTIAGVALVNRR